VIIHRVTAITDEGAITIGDNNELTDQAAGEPPVTQQNTTGKAFMFNGTPLYIPFLGYLFYFFLLYTLESLVLLITGSVIWIYMRDSLAQKSKQDILRIKDIVNPIFFTVFIGLIVVIFIGSVTFAVPLTYTTSETASQQQYVIHIDEQNPTEEITFKVDDSVGTKTVVSSYNIIDVTQENTDFTLKVDVPEKNTIGQTPGYVTVYTFPPILPQQTLQSLTNITPLIPAVISAFTFLFPLYTLFYMFGSPNDRVEKTKNRLLFKIYRQLK
jgi:signal peptidase